MTLQKHTLCVLSLQNENFRRKRLFAFDLEKGQFLSDSEKIIYEGRLLTFERFGSTPQNREMTFEMHYCTVYNWQTEYTNKHYTFEAWNKIFVSRLWFLDNYFQSIHTQFERIDFRNFRISTVQQNEFLKDSFSKWTLLPRDNFLWIFTFWKKIDWKEYLREITVYVSQKLISNCVRYKRHYL